MAEGRKAAGALQGAGLGAQVGTAIVPGIGTAIGGGLGALGGALFTSGKPTEFESYVGESLEDLKRRQELNQLGLTPEEVSALMAKTVDPIKRQQRDAREQYLETAAGTGVGAADIQRGLQGAEQREAQALSAPLADIVLVDEQRKLKEEQDIADLMALEADMDARRKEQLMSGVLGVGQALAVGAVASGDLLADMEYLRGADTSQSEKYKELGEFTSWLSGRKN